MKILLTILLLVATLLFMGCSAPKGAMNKNTDSIGSTVEVHNPQLSLDEYLKRLSGVRVYGSGISAQIEMRGKSSLELSNEPLFVMDNIRLGRDFDKIYSVVDMNQVNRLTALHSSKATLYYGHDGYAGVIEISTGN